MKRGDIALGVMPGDFGKPRPVIIIQSDRLHRFASVLVCPLTSDLEGYDFRIRLEPDTVNGLLKTSDIMVEKLTAIPRIKCREKIGTLTSDQMERVSGLLAVVLGLVD